VVIASMSSFAVSISRAVNGVPLGSAGISSACAADLVGEEHGLECHHFIVGTDGHQVFLVAVQPRWRCRLCSIRAWPLRSKAYALAAPSPWGAK